jgi:hypothetical protein
MGFSHEERRRKRRAPDTAEAKSKPPERKPTSARTSALLDAAPAAVRLSDNAKQADATPQAEASDHAPAPPEAQASAVPPIVGEVLHSAGQPLDADARSRMEQLTGRDLSGVRVHTDERAAESASAIDSLAYTAGPHIVFGLGQYAPHTSEGQRLLAHEAAHAAHQEESGINRAGVAPPDSLAERQADEFAASATEQQPTPAPPDFHNWGDAWQIHAHQIKRIVTKGTVEHTGLVTAYLGQVVPVGVVEVRTGEEIEAPDGTLLSNFIALEYSGALTPDSKWLQFAWMEMVATTPSGLKRSTGSIPTSSGTQPFTTNPSAPNWSVDSADISDPFYEASFAHLRTASSTTMFDAPGGETVEPFARAVFKSGIGATGVIFTLHFDTYLVQNNVAAYHVAYSASTVFAMSGTDMVGGNIGYLVEAGGPVRGLPANLKTVLYASYPYLKNVR